MACPFFAQPRESTCFQGLQGNGREISTKLSTEFLDYLQKLSKIKDLRSKPQKGLRFLQGPLAQTRGAFPVDAFAPPDLCTKIVMQRNIGTHRAIPPGSRCAFAKMIDS